MELTFALAVLKQIQAMPKVDAKRIVAAMREVAANHPQRMAYVTDVADTVAVPALLMMNVCPAAGDNNEMLGGASVKVSSLNTSGVRIIRICA